MDYQGHLSRSWLLLQQKLGWHSSCRAGRQPLKCKDHAKDKDRQKLGNYSMICEKIVLWMYELYNNFITCLPRTWSHLCREIILIILTSFSYSRYAEVNFVRNLHLKIIKFQNYKHYHLKLQTLEGGFAKIWYGFHKKRCMAKFQNEIPKSSNRFVVNILLWGEKFKINLKKCWTYNCYIPMENPVRVKS